MYDANGEKHRFGGITDNPGYSCIQPPISITRRAEFHPERRHFARLTSGELRYVPIRPRYERICTQKHTARQCSEECKVLGGGFFC